MEYRMVTEGSTTFAAPVQDENTQFPPGTAPVFYNTKMEFNRDMTVLLLSHLKPAEYLDSMAATGVRGLRVAHETGTPVIINDRDSAAVAMIEENAKLVGGDISVTCDDANRMMCGKYFDAIDLDPFGTPAPFFDAASRAARHYLFVTATDTAPLCGAHLKAGIRRYFATPKNTEYHAEVGLRMMMGAMAKELVKYDRGMEPILSFARNHYFRSHVRILNRVTGADATMGQIGFVMQCPKCLYRAEQKGSLLPKFHVCPYCGAETEPIGPLWMGSLQDKEIVASMIETLPTMQFGTAKQMDKVLRLLLAEPDVCTFYDYHVISRNIRVSPPPMDEMIAGLNELGYYTVRTHFSVTGIKTSAPLPVIEEWIAAWNEKLGLP
ncbi:tRNA (guanine(10)-N(2))-dimethyltransferase [Methanorbis rubei]|uniref:tRNA (guanine(26)-N(2))-dimethyltransferase n=1 Tax=Methanorbis rubei TaxID=3028300 RepID=A0AAE4MG99_9EURY|nr:tRNA (guanine(26)-N(2)/guanine(27)-N(2))-dimethyltransferase [Methanocorpusculaceae archaeon Cs1]